MHQDIHTEKMRLAHAQLDHASRNARGFLSTLDSLMIDARWSDKVDKSFLEHMQRQRRIAADFLENSSFELASYVHELYERYSELFASRLLKKEGEL